MRRTWCDVSGLFSISIIVSAAAVLNIEAGISYQRHEVQYRSGGRGARPHEVALQLDQAEVIIQDFAYRKVHYTPTIPHSARWLHMSRSFLSV
jgi:hypothetical protein